MKKLKEVLPLTKVLAAFLSLVMIFDLAPLAFAVEALQNIQENNGPVISVEEEIEKSELKPSPIPSGAIFSDDDSSPLSSPIAPLPTQTNSTKTPLDRNDAIFKEAKKNLGNTVVSGVKINVGLDNPTIYEFFDAQGKQVGKYIKGGLLNADEWRSIRALTESEKKEVKSILGVQASTVELIRRENGALLISIFYDEKNNVIGQREIRNAADEKDSIRKETVWSNAQGKTVQVQKVLADGTTYVMDGDQRFIQVSQDFYPYAMGKNLGPRHHLVVNFINGIASRATLQKFDESGTLLQSENYESLSLLNTRTSTCPTQGDGPCSLMVADYMMPQGEFIRSFDTVTKVNGWIVTRSFSLWGIISQINFVKEHKIQIYKDGELSQVQIHLDPDPEPVVCPKGELCIQVERVLNPYKTVLTVNFQNGETVSASINRTVKATGKLDFIKTFESLEAFQTAISECPANPFSGAPCSLQNLSYLPTPGFENERIGNFSITTRRNGFIKITQFDLYGLVKRITEAGTTQDFVNGKLSKLVQTSEDGKTKITVNYKEGNAVSATVQSLEDGKVTRTLFYNPVVALETATGECPDNNFNGMPCSLKQKTVTAPGGSFGHAGSFTVRTVKGGVITTKVFELFGVLTETRLSDGTRMLLEDVVFHGEKTRAITSMIIVKGGRKVQVTFDHATFQQMPDPEVVKAAVLNLLSASANTKNLTSIKIRNYQYNPEKPGACTAGFPSMCVENYLLDLVGNDKITYFYEATVTTKNMPDSKIISVTQRLPV